MTNNVTENEITLKKKIKKALLIKKSLNPKNQPKLKKQTGKGNGLPLFCTECGKELDLFWLTDKASDKNAVKINQENCVKIGKFKGHYCSKMFISNAYTEKVLRKKK
jgi:hypothetical protein